MSAATKKAQDAGIEFYFPHELAKATLEFLVAPATTATTTDPAPPTDGTTPTTDGATPSSEATTTPPPADGTATPPADGTAPATPPPADSVPAAGATGAAVYKRGVVTTPPWYSGELAIDGTTGTLLLDFLSAGVLDRSLTLEDSPFLIKGPPLPKSLPKPPQRPHKTLSAKGKLGINFGKDKLTITVALNGGGGAAASGGAGAGYVASGAGGQGGAVTANAKGYSFNPVFEVGPLLKSDETIIIALRCMLRYFYHWCDALNLAVDFLKTKAPQAGSAQDFMSEFLGFNWWMFVFSMFAMKDMLFDIIADEADFIAEILQKIGIEAKFDVNAAGNFDMEVGVDASATVSGRAYVPLAVMLAPLIEFLMAGSTAPAPAGGSLADKIVPFIEGIVEDRVSIAVGGMPAAFMVEAKGTLARCTFAVPKGSPLRAKIEKVGEGLAKAAEHYKSNKLRTLPDETKLLRLIIDLLDHEVRNMVKMVRAAQKVGDGETAAGLHEGTDALSAGVAAATPYVQQIMDALQGKKTAEPPGISPEAEAVVGMLRSTKVHGVALGTMGPLEASENGERKRLVLHVEDDEKATILGAGFTPPSLEPELETTTLEVALPVRPTAVGWNYVSRNPRLANDYAGIIAGYDDDGGRNACKQACRARGWIPDELGRFEDQHPNDMQGLRWAWVAVGLSATLAHREPPLPMPELELTDAGHLRLTFDELPIGAVPDELRSEIPLLAGATIKREKIWKLVLMESATSEESEAIGEEMDKNQPTDDPYETVLDELLV